MHLNLTTPTGSADCLTARRTLELAIPDQSDGKAEQAREHVQACAACQRAIALREKIDARLTAVCRDVEVPAGLKERLRSALQIDPSIATDVRREAAVSAAVGDGAASGGGRRSGRRAWLRTVVATAASLMLFAGGAWVWYAAHAPSVSLDELCRHMLGIFPETDDLPPFASFSDGSAPQLPATMSTRSLVSPPKQVSFGGERVAVYLFSLPARPRLPVVQGFLIVVPVSKVVDVPAATSFLAAGPNYRRLGYCATAWVEGDFAYLCCVSGGEPNLKRLVPNRPDFL